MVIVGLYVYGVRLNQMKIQTERKKARMATWSMCKKCNAVIYSAAYFKVVDLQSRKTKRQVIGKYCEECKTFFHNGAVKKVAMLEM